MKIGISVTPATFAFIRIMNRYKLSYSTLAFLTIGNQRKPDATSRIYHGDRAKRANIVRLIADSTRITR